MRAQISPVKTVSLLSLPTNLYIGTWTVTLAWALGIDGFLPFCSDTVSVAFIKVYCVCLTSGFTHCDTTGEMWVL